MSSDEIRKLCVGKREIKMSAYLLEIVPVSCTFFDSLSGIDEKIEGPYFSRDVEKDLAGTKRIFKIKMYRIQGSYCDYFFAGEVLTPLRTLKTMQESPIGGMSADMMDRQRDKTVSQLEAILKFSATPKKCKLIRYDDVRKRKTLSEIILEEIESEGMVDMVQKYDRWLKIQEQ